MTTPKAFLHPTNIRNDIRIKRAQRDIGKCMAYGAIIGMIEVLADHGGKYPASDLDILGEELGVTLPILTTIVNSYGFFTTIMGEDGTFYICPELNIWLEPWHQKVEKNRLLAKKSALVKKTKIQLQIQELTHNLSVLGSSTPNNKVINEMNKKEINKSLSNSEESCSFFNKTQDLKEHLINKYNNTGAEWQNIAGYSSLTIRNGYLHNTISSKDLTPAEAIQAWGEITSLYQNQNKEGEKQ